jgi:uncharacterized membrane protein
LQSVLLAKKLFHVCFTLKIINCNEFHSDLISLFERWNDFLFLITDDRDFRPQTCTNGLIFRECKHTCIKNIFEDVYFTKNSYFKGIILVLKEVKFLAFLALQSVLLAKKLFHVCFTLKIINCNEFHSNLISLFEKLDKSLVFRECKHIKNVFRECKHDQEYF